jgi:hypothetical protein
MADDSSGDRQLRPSFMYTLDFSRRLSHMLLWGSVVAALIVIVTG